MSRSDIDALNAIFMKGMEERDGAMVASVYGPGARLLPPGSDALTGPAIAEYWQQALAPGVEGGSLETVSLEELGDVAIEEGVYSVRAGGEVVERGKYVVVHRRQDDGTWKLATDIWNSSEPEAPPS